MSCYQSSISLATTKNIELLDITPRVQEAVLESGIESGYALVFSPHTTSGILINENESRLVRDFETALCGILPKSSGYLHDEIDNNAAAHITGGFIGNQAYLIVDHKGVKLGRWQSVFFVELDGPKPREVFIQVFGEA